MSILTWIIFSTALISILSLAGVLAFFLKEEVLKKVTLPLVALSAGALLSGAFFHLVPEALENCGSEDLVFGFVIIGFATFFLMEQFIHWHHCHRMPSEHKAPVTYLVLIADAIHNFIDGLAVGSAFIFDIRLGLVTVLVVAAHEIPQELGDFGILIHGGWKKMQALLFNFLSSITVIIGGLTAYFISAQINIVYLLPFAAGSFIYIASSDLIPEIKHSDNVKKNILHYLTFLLGIAIVYSVKFLE